MCINSIDHIWGSSCIVFTNMMIIPSTTVYAVKKYWLIFGFTYGNFFLLLVIIIWEFFFLVFIQCNDIIITWPFHFILLCSQVSESLNLQIWSFFFILAQTLLKTSHPRYDFSAPSFDHHHMLRTHSCNNVCITSADIWKKKSNKI